MARDRIKSANFVKYFGLTNPLTILPHPYFVNSHYDFGQNECSNIGKPMRTVWN